MKFPQNLASRKGREKLAAFLLRQRPWQDERPPLCQRFTRTDRTLSVLRSSPAAPRQSRIFSTLTVCLQRLLVQDSQPSLNEKLTALEWRGQCTDTRLQRVRLSSRAVPHTLLLGSRCAEHCNTGNVGKAPQHHPVLVFLFQKWPLGSSMCTWDVIWHGEEVQDTFWKQL